MSELELSSFVLYIWSAGPIFQIGLILGKFPRGSTFHYPRRLRLVVLRLMLMPLMLTPSHFLIREVFFRTCEAGATYLEARGQKGITISLCLFSFFETKCFSTVCTVLCLRWGGQSPIHATSVKAGQPVWSCTI